MVFHESADKSQVSLTYNDRTKCRSINQYQPQAFRCVSSLLILYCSDPIYIRGRECSVLFCIYDSSHMIEIHCHWLCMSTHRPYNVFRLRSTPYTRPNSAANHAPNPTLMTTKTLIISSLSHHSNSIRSGCSMVTRVEWWRGARVRTCRIWQRSDARASPCNNDIIITTFRHCVLFSQIPDLCSEGCSRYKP